MHRCERFLVLVGTQAYTPLRGEERSQIHLLRKRGPARTEGAIRSRGARVGIYRYSWTIARMDPSRSLLDALNDSITSGTFVDTKFYVFSRREASGRVGSPLALYCNSRVLDTVPYFSSCGSQKFCDITHLTTRPQSVLRWIFRRADKGHQRGVSLRLPPLHRPLRLPV